MGEVDYRWEMLEALRELIRVAEADDDLVDEDSKELVLARARDAVKRGSEKREEERKEFF